MPWSSQYIAELNTARVHPGAGGKKKNLTRFCLHHGECSTDKSDGADADVHGTGGGSGWGPSGAFGIRSDRHGDQVARTLLPIDGALGLGHGGTSRRGRARGRGSRRHGGFLGDAAGGNAGVGLIDLGLAASEIRRRQQKGDLSVQLDLAAGACRCAPSNGGFSHAHIAVTRAGCCIKIALPSNRCCKGITAADGGALAGASLGSCEEVKKGV